MITNDAGRALIMRFEGCRLEAYLCPAGIITIGYGHTGDVKKGDKITQHQAETILEYDLQRFEACVAASIPKTANMNQSAACVSLAFNIGERSFRTSTLVKRFKEGGPIAAAPHFLSWNKATVKGKLVELPGLTKRREAERQLFLTPVNQA